MPFTPLHMGPGIAIKAIAGNHFSLTIFGLSQVFMDLEPLIRILDHEPVVHGWSHTYLGATIIGAIVIFAGKAPFQFLLGQWLDHSHSLVLQWFSISRTITWTAAITGAFIGTFSHVLLDSMLYSDIAPWAPFTEANGMLDLMSVQGVQGLCVISGILGFLAMLVAGIIRTQRASRKKRL